MSVESIRKPQNISTCIVPATGSARTFFWPNQPVRTSLKRRPHESKRSSGAPLSTKRVAFWTW